MPQDQPEADAQAEVAASSPPTWPVIEIRCRWNKDVLFAVEAASMRLAVEAAVKNRANLQSADLQSADLQSANLQWADLQWANLRGANLRGANLRGANLQSADLQSADLQSADLQSADLKSANLQSADLQSADLKSANLQWADLQSADLKSANLQWANLQSADLQWANLQSVNLQSVKINWNSHVLISRILLDAAGQNVGRRKIAGLVLVSTDWCWKKWVSLKASRHFSWAVDVLAAFVQDGDNSPQFLRERAAELALLRGAALRSAGLQSADLQPNPNA